MERDTVKNPSPAQRKRIVPLILMKSVETILTNHIYLFDNKVYRQVTGGPIGDNITNLCSKLVIFAFQQGYKHQLHKLDLESSTVLLKDDLDQAGYCLPLGTYYKSGKMYVPGSGWRGKSDRPAISQ